MTIIGDKKFKDRDMEVAAVFRTHKKSPTYYLITPETEMVEGQPRMKPGTGLRIKAQDYRIVCENWALFDILIKHRRFEDDGMNGFRPEPLDPSHFWRDLGIVQEREVKTYVPKQRYVDAETRKTLTSAKVKKQLAQVERTEDAESAVLREV